MKRLNILLTICLCLAACTEHVDVKVVNPKVNMFVNPLGIVSPKPTFSWQIVTSQNDVVQTSYQILVASSEKALKNNEGDLWDTGIVNSTQSAYIRYAGKPLGSRDRAYWKVQVRTNRGLTSWSDVNVFEVALLNQSDWKASWIGHAFPQDCLEGKTRLPARYLRKEFATTGKKVKQARLYISGLGQYEAYINGKQVDDATYVLKPTVADYDKSVPYNTYDVTQLIREQNTLGVILGNGRYVGLRSRGVKHYDVPKLLFQLEIAYADGSREQVVSDSSWKITADGPICSNNEWDGEYYDARKEMPGWNENGFDDNAWLQAELVVAPTGKVKPQLNPNIKIQDRLKPVEMLELPGDTIILDMGQNMVGWLQLKAKAQVGDSIHLRFAETLQDDGRLYTANLRSAEAADWYVARDDKPFIWHPLFVYHGFRFVEVTGLKKKPTLDDFEGQVFYDEMQTIGSFETSNEVLSRVYKNAYWGIRGNYRGMPTDCPQRDERMGWFGDRTEGAYGESYIFDNHALYIKWLDDVEESQKESGSVPDVAPIFWDICRDNMTWPGAYITIANMMLEQFGDSKPIERHYDSMKRWLTYMKDKYVEDGIMTKDRYGDWCMPPESLELIHSKDPSRITEAEAISTPFYYYLLNMMQRFAMLLNKEDDAIGFGMEKLQVQNSYNEKFLRAEGYYANNTVTANILPLKFGMVPEDYKDAVIRHIVDKTVNEFNSHVCCGVVGIGQLMRGLTENGNIDLAFRIASNKTYPSWGYMAEHGATTIWELWNGNTADPAMNSGNHVMLLGDLVTWMYQYLGGIGNAEGSVGYETVQLKPYPVQGLDYVNASYDCIYGKIQSNWRKENGQFIWNITIPANTTGKVCIPLEKMSDADVKDVERAGGLFVGMEQGYTVFSFPSGNYNLVTKY